MPPENICAPQDAFPPPPNFSPIVKPLVWIIFWWDFDSSIHEETQVDVETLEDRTLLQSQCAGPILVPPINNQMIHILRVTENFVFFIFFSLKLQEFQALQLKESRWPCHQDWYSGLHVAVTSHTNIGSDGCAVSHSKMHLVMTPVYRSSRCAECRTNNWHTNLIRGHAALPIQASLIPHKLRTHWYGKYKALKIQK